MEINKLIETIVDSNDFESLKLVLKPYIVKYEKPEELEVKVKTKKVVSKK